MLEEIYKYVPMERIDILQSKKICFAKKDQLNDSFEFETNFKIHGNYKEDLDFFIGKICSSSEFSQEKFFLMNLKSKYEKLLKIKLTLNDFLMFLSNINPEVENMITSNLDIINKDYIKFVKNTLCVLCLTESNNSDYMWGHYANSSTGFMIGFNKEHSFFDRRNSEHDLLRCLKDVLYLDNLPTIYIDDSMNKEGMISYYMFHHKHTEHAQEKEYRIVDVIKNASYVTESGYHLFDIPEGLITSITLGHKTSLYDEDNIKKLIKNDVFFKNVLLFKSIPNRKTRVIDRFEIIKRN